MFGARDVIQRTNSSRHVSEWPQRQSDLICALQLVTVNVPLVAPIGGTARVASPLADCALRL
jgi:hypothetical protein